MKEAKAIYCQKYLCQAYLGGSENHVVIIFNKDKLHRSLVMKRWFHEPYINTQFDSFACSSNTLTRIRHHHF